MPGGDSSHEGHSRQHGLVSRCLWARPELARGEGKQRWRDVPTMPAATSKVILVTYKTYNYH